MQQPEQLSKTAPIVIYRTYARRDFEQGARESWDSLIRDRVLPGIAKEGKLSPPEQELLNQEVCNLRVLPAGRMLWVAGTDWFDKPENFPGAFNCFSIPVTQWEDIELSMDLLMQGSGVGQVLEDRFISQLPPICNELSVEVVGEFGSVPPEERTEQTYTHIHGNTADIVVGDSRQGWAQSPRELLALSSDPSLPNKLKVRVDISHIRPYGEPLKQFGGVANPTSLPDLYPRIARITNGALGRKLNAEEVCLAIDEAGKVVVSGNIRRAASIKQFDNSSPLLKQNLWQQDENGNFFIDPNRDALRMSNHTRVWHSKPSKETCIEAVRSQFYSGEGAIQYAPEAIARANADLFPNRKTKHEFKRAYEKGKGREFLLKYLPEDTPEHEVYHRLTRYGLNPCARGDMRLLTSEGYQPIETLSGKEVSIVNKDGVEVPSKVWCSGEKDVYKVTLSNNKRLYFTADHRFMTEDGETEVKNLKGKILVPYEDEGPPQVTEVEYDGTELVYDFTEPLTHWGVIEGMVVHNCSEIIGSHLQCNLSEIVASQLDPNDPAQQKNAFAAGTLSAASLLNRNFTQHKLRWSRDLDPIIGVSATGIFDFFVYKFGVEWLYWWAEGRRRDHPRAKEFLDEEAGTLTWWRRIVHQSLKEFCVARGLKMPNRYTCAQPSGCLSREALRVFDQGLLYADEMVSPGSGESQGLGLSVRKGIDASSAIANEPMSLVKVILNNGRVLRMTPNHRLSLSGKWTRADQMVPGETVDTELGTYTKAEEADLLPVDTYRYTKDRQQEIVGHRRGVLTKTVTFPTKVDTRLAYILGCLYGNGHLSRHKARLRFSHGNPEVLQEIQSCLNQLFGLEDTRINSTQDRKYTLEVGSQQLYDWLHLNGLNKDGKSVDIERIPQKVRRSSRESILSFIAGLIDTDGCIRKEGRLTIDLANEAFIRNLQQVGEAVGLCFSISHNTKGKNKQKVKNIWSLHLVRYYSTAEAIASLNQMSIKAQTRPIAKPKRRSPFNPYTIVSVERETMPDYSYDFSVAGVDDDDSWYWQGGIKSHNTKSLITNSSPGWHPPKALRYIRRITCERENPVALAAIDYGYNVIPSQSQKDEQGRLLDDPYDPRCNEWLIEVPVQVNWADLEGADQVDPNQFSATAQFDFYMQLQKHYCTHTASGTIEFREHEIEPLGEAIHEGMNDGYISCALMARFDSHQTFPRLPYEPVDEATYRRLVQEVEQRRVADDFIERVNYYDQGGDELVGPGGCENDKCLLDYDQST